ncbi:Hypothetical protein FKW44_004594 [Caligus rogercresseyi]|uniref:Uncharacterized protein n=1 Tax=Caligus rogercresseyi TaxID=217165 RepID=A0A7T8HLS8_CALRO|nr:Hypothetical protein FKW44_004594 [Caligus rogercresseyi]
MQKLCVSGWLVAGGGIRTEEKGKRERGSSRESKLANESLGGCSNQYRSHKAPPHERNRTRSETRKRVRRTSGDTAFLPHDGGTIFWEGFHSSSVLSFVVLGQSLVVDE